MAVQTPLGRSARPSALAWLLLWFQFDRQSRNLGMSNAVMGLRLKQQLTLTPRLQQSVKLLQLSALECVQELHQAIAQNPFLEEPADSADSRSQGEEGAAYGAAEDTSRSDLDFSGSGSSSSGGDDTPDWPEWTAAPAALDVGRDED